MAVDLAQVIPPLVRAKVDFILIGGMAAILHGSARVTVDVGCLLAHARKHGAPRQRSRALPPVALRGTAGFAI